MMCRHCQQTEISRPRGLCWSCYYTPGVKEQYPSTSKYARRGVGNFSGNAPLPEAPTSAPPGSAGAPERKVCCPRRPLAGAREDAVGQVVDVEAGALGTLDP